MKTSASKSPVLIGLIAATAGFAGLAAVVRNNPSEAPGPLKPEFVRAQPAVQEPSGSTKREPAKIVGEDTKPQVTDRAVVRYVALQGGEPTLTKEIALKPGEDARVRSLGETVKSLGYAEVRVLKVDVEKGEATVDMSPGLLNLGFGSSEESTLIKALGQTLGQFEDVKTFTLRVDGQKVDSLGHLELSEPTPVIRPDQGTDESETPSREPNP